jgi:hypothetical protein
MSFYINEGWDDTDKINNINKDMDNMSTLELVCATEYEEFFYEDTNDPVEEGEPIGLNIDSEDGVDLVLFSNIYWKPQHNE